jgi:hypothetical protein
MIQAVKKAVDQLSQFLPQHIQDADKQWAAELEDALNQMGQWQGLRFEDRRQQLLDELKAPAAATEPKDVLVHTREAARKMRFEVLHRLPQTAVVATFVINQLKSLSDPALEAPIKKCEETTLLAVEKLRGADLEQLHEVAKAVGTLRETLTDGISAAMKPAPSATLQAPDGLCEGDFSKAVNAVVVAARAAAPRPMGGTGTAAPLAAGILPTMVELPMREEPAPSRAWAITILFPSSPVVGEWVTLAVDVQGDAPATLEVEWFIDGAFVGKAEHGNLSHRFQPDRSGQLRVRAVAIVRGTGERSVAQTMLQIRPTEGYAALTSLQAGLHKSERTQTFISGLLITAIGFAIFRASFVGSWEDFLAAILWGFTIDIGVAKVREMATPLMGRTLPLAGKP